MLFSRRSCVSPSNCTVTTQTPPMKNAVTGAKKNLHGRLHALLSRVWTRLRSRGNVTPPCTSLHRQWRRYMDQSGNRQTAPVDKPIEHPKQCVNFTPGPDGISENDSVLLTICKWRPLKSLPIVSPYSLAEHIRLREGATPRQSSAQTISHPELLTISLAGGPQSYSTPWDFSIKRAHRVE